MKDIQNQHDPRKIEIQKVGVKNVKYPIVVLDKNNHTQATVATINMYADLPHDIQDDTNDQKEEGDDFILPSEVCHGAFAYVAGDLIIFSSPSAAFTTCL